MTARRESLVEQRRPHNLDVDCWVTDTRRTPVDDATQAAMVRETATACDHLATPSEREPIEQKI